MPLVRWGRSEKVTVALSRVQVPKAPLRDAGNDNEVSDFEPFRTEPDEQFELWRSSGHLVDETFGIKKGAGSCDFLPSSQRCDLKLAIFCLIMNGIALDFSEDRKEIP